ASAGPRPVRPATRLGSRLDAAEPGPGLFDRGRIVGGQRGSRRVSSGSARRARRHHADVRRRAGCLLSSHPGSVSSPWPEEVNRRLVTHIADLHFAPTARARNNLLREGIRGERIVVTGNTGIDALLWVSDVLDRKPQLRSRFTAVLPAHCAGRRVIL